MRRPDLLTTSGIVTYRQRVDLPAAWNGTTAIDLDIDLANTLGPYMRATSPTPFVLSGQDVSGLFGPVRLLTSG